MQVFVTVDGSNFRYNGLKFIKLFMVIKQNETHLSIHNVYDTSLQLLSSTHFNQVQVDGVVYNTLTELIDVLTPLLYAAPASTAASDANFVYVQNIPATVWTINHTLNKKPSVTVTDTANTVVMGQIEYISLSQIKISFSAAFSGTVILN